MTLAAPAARARCAPAERRATLRAIITDLKTRSAPARRGCVGRLIGARGAGGALGSWLCARSLAQASAFRCGHCTSGFIMMLTKSLDEHSDPDDETKKLHLQQAVQPAP